MTEMTAEAQGASMSRAPDISLCDQVYVQQQFSGLVHNLNEIPMNNPYYNLHVKYELNLFMLIF